MLPYSDGAEITTSLLVALSPSALSFDSIGPASLSSGTLTVSLSRPGGLLLVVSSVTTASLLAKTALTHWYLYHQLF